MVCWCVRGASIERCMVCWCVGGGPLCFHITLHDHVYTYINNIIAIIVFCACALLTNQINRTRLTSHVINFYDDHYHSANQIHLRNPLRDSSLATVDARSI